MPDIGGKEERGESACTWVEQFLTQEIDAQHGEDSNHTTGKPQAPRFKHGREQSQKLCLNVDEQAFSAIVLRIEYLVVARPNSREGVNPVHGFIMIETGSRLVVPIPE